MLSCLCMFKMEWAQSCFFLKVSFNWTCLSNSKIISKVVGTMSAMSCIWYLKGKKQIVKISHWGYDESERKSFRLQLFGWRRNWEIGWSESIVLDASSFNLSFSAQSLEWGSSGSSYACHLKSQMLTWPFISSLFSGKTNLTWYLSFTKTDKNSQRAVSLLWVTYMGACQLH